MAGKLSLSILVLSGCVGPGKLDTPSGRPEVFLPGATIDQVSAACLKRLVSRGWLVEQNTPTFIQAKREMPSGEAVLMAMSFDAADTPYHQATYTLGQEKDGVRVFLSLAATIPRRYGGEQVIPYNAQAPLNEAQRALEEIRGELVPGSPPSKIPLRQDRGTVGP